MTVSCIKSLNVIVPAKKNINYLGEDFSSLVKKKEINVQTCK